MGGIRSGVNGTPTFFINGVRHDGPYDYASLVAGIQNTVRRRYRYMTDFAKKTLGSARLVDKGSPN
jgi:Thioredoxin